MPTPPDSDNRQHQEQHAPARRDDRAPPHRDQYRWHNDRDHSVEQLRGDDLRTFLEDRYAQQRAAGGIKPFSYDLKWVHWPQGFRLGGEIRIYNGYDDPKHWIMLYETAVQAAGGEEHVMANYLPCILGSTTFSWLMCQPKGSIYSRRQLKQMMIDNFKSTCDQPSIRYALAAIHDYPDESLRNYIRRWSDAYTRCRDVQDADAINLFIQGCRAPRSQDLRKELLKIRP